MTKTLAFSSRLQRDSKENVFRCCKERNSEKEMEQIKQHTKNKGGRSKKRVKQDQLLSVKCSLFERVAIETKAKWANLSVSAYLRRMGLTRQN